MKSKVGKITGATLAALLIILMAANLIVPLVRPIVATPINPRAVPSLGNAELQGDVWYVDGNMLADTGTGKSWADAKKYLSSAMALSHADIARDADRQWAGRNTIYVKGDAITEDLTALAQKTDIIGVGCNNPYNKAAILGNHDIASTTGYPSCRFYNMQFYGDEAAELWDVDGQGGLEFHECLFQASGTATVGLEASECGHLKVIECWFGSAGGSNFTSAAIEIPNDTTGQISVLIKDNFIHSDGIGINWDETVNVDCWIVDNFFFTGGMAIDSEDVTEVMVMGNRMKVGVASADDTSNDFNILYGVDNIVTGSDSTVYIPSPADF